MNIRLATEADIPQLRSLAARIWRACYPGIITGEQIEFMLEWMYSEEKIREELHHGFTWELAELAGEAIGFQAYHLDEQRRCKLDKIYLLPEHQGLGHARTMLGQVLAVARELEAAEVWLQVNKKNARAIAAYQRAGFHIAEEKTFEIGEGFVMDDYLMVKRVEA